MKLYTDKWIGFQSFDGAIPALLQFDAPGARNLRETGRSEKCLGVAGSGKKPEDLGRMRKNRNRVLKTCTLNCDCFRGEDESRLHFSMLFSGIAIA